MVFLVGTVGFIAGFIMGQLILNRLLKNYSKDELLQDKSVHWKYGSLNWLLAIMTSAAAVWLYDKYLF